MIDKKKLKWSQKEDKANEDKQRKKIEVYKTELKRCSEQDKIAQQSLLDCEDRNQI